MLPDTNKSFRRFGIFLQFVLVALAICGSGRLALTLPQITSNISPIWLPAGIALAALYRWGAGLWPAAAAGSFLINLSVGTPALTALGISVGSTLSPLLMAWMLRHSDFTPDFARDRNLGWFALATVTGPLLAATGGVVTMWLGGTVATADIGHSWMILWLGDILGVILLGPFLLTVSLRDVEASKERWLEALIFLGTATVLGYLIFAVPEVGEKYFVLTSFVLLVWAALRFGFCAGSAFVVVASILGIWGTTVDYGPFQNSSDVLSFLWLFAGASAGINIMIATLRSLEVETRLRLENSEQKLQALADSIDDVIAVSDRARRVRHVSASVVDLIGYAREEVVGRSVSDFLLKEDYLRLLRRSPLYVVGSTSAQRRMEVRLRHKDGNAVWVESAVKIVTSANGEEEIVSASRDITSRKHVEFAMQAVSSDLAALEGQAYYEAAAIHLARLTCAEVAFIARLDAGRPGELNALAMLEDGGIVRNYKYSSLGTPCADVLASGVLIVPNNAQSRYPADGRLPDQSIESYAGAPLLDRVMRPLGIIGIMSRRPFHDERMIANVMRIFTVAVAAMMERERNRRQYQDLFEFAPDGLVMVDRGGGITLANRQAEKIFGWTREELRGQPIEVLVPVAARSRHASLRKSFDTRDTQCRPMSMGRRVLMGRRKDGAEFPAEIDLAPIAFEDGVMIAAAVRDISERRMLEEQLAQSTKMEAIGKLTGGMAHDFNNYLGIIISNLDLLSARVTTDAAASKLVDAALRGALRGSELIQSLIAFARRQPLAPQLTELDKSLRAMGYLLKGILGGDIKIHVTLAPDLWPVRIDGSQFESCILNLANNARDAMPDGGDLTISARNTVLEQLPTAKESLDVIAGGYVLIEVTDTGVGMSADVIEHVFEPFFTTKPAGHGTGLGLSMVYGFIKQSGGHIRIRSGVDAGTTVQIYLPRAARNGRAEAGVSTDRHDTLPGGAETILVVEDNAEMREALVAQLVSLGYRVVEAENAMVALAILEDRKVHVNLLFTDIVMPGMLDGYELALRARAKDPALKTLLTSGYPGSRQGQKSGGVPPIHLLRKPYRRDELAQAVRAALDAQKSSHNEATSAGSE